MSSEWRGAALAIIAFAILPPARYNLSVLERHKSTGYAGMCAFRQADVSAAHFPRLPMIRGGLTCASILIAVHSGRCCAVCAAAAEGSAKGVQKDMGARRRSMFRLPGPPRRDMGTGNSPGLPQAGNSGILRCFPLFFVCRVSLRHSCGNRLSQIRQAPAFTSAICPRRRRPAPPSEDAAPLPVRRKNRRWLFSHSKREMCV